MFESPPLPPLPVHHVRSSSRSSLPKLVPLLTETNRETLLSRAAHQSKRKIEELVAELSPKPDVPATLRKLPERRESTQLIETELGPDRAQKRDPTRELPLLLGTVHSLQQNSEKEWAIAAAK